MSVWKLLLLFELGLVSVVLVFVFVAWRRKQQKVAKAHSPEHRLKIPNVWTETQRLKKGSSIQMMRMKDGTFMLLSVGPDAAKVLVSPQWHSLEAFTELASFPMGKSPRSHRQQTGILNDLRNQIGFPHSEGELRNKLQGVSLLDRLAND